MESAEFTFPFEANSSYREDYVKHEITLRSAPKPALLVEATGYDGESMQSSYRAAYVPHAMERRNLSSAAKATADATAFEGNSSYRVRLRLRLAGERSLACVNPASASLAHFRRTLLSMRWSAASCRLQPRPQWRRCHLGPIAATACVLCLRLHLADGAHLPALTPSLPLSLTTGGLC